MMRLPMPSLPPYDLFRRRVNSNRTMLEEIRDRDIAVKSLRRQKKKRQNENAITNSTSRDTTVTNSKTQSSESKIQVTATTIEPFPEQLSEAEIEDVKLKKSVPYVRVYDYEELKREAGLL
jgi:putative transposase